MKLNEFTALSSSQILLVPYEPHHVPTYHQWMEDPHIREATASERLTLSEELEMQRSWRDDADKLTFICAMPLDMTYPGKLEVVAGLDDAPERLLGDVNLFLYEEEEEEEEEEGGEGKGKKKAVGEIELMIPRSEDQGKGFGRAALLLFLSYILQNQAAIMTEQRQQLVLSTLRVKINQTNIRSIRLFEKFGFCKVGEGPNYFGEFELRVDLGPAFEQRVKELTEADGAKNWAELRYTRGA